VRISREILLLAGSLFVIAAVYNHYIGGHSAYLLEIIFVGIGVSLALLSLWPQDKKTEQPEDEGLLVRFLTRFLSKEKCFILIPLAGFVLILAWSAWKLFVVGDADLHMEDLMVTLFGLSLVLYNAGPSRFAVQKDFVVLYLLFLTIVFAVIWKLYTIITGESYVRVTAYAEYYFVTTPVVTLLQLIGVNAHASLANLSNIIDYEHHGRMLRVAIGTSCSGLYSTGLFFSAFLAFVLVRYNRVDRNIIAALGVGFFVTWASNILRMVITVLVGSAYGHPALAFVHSYIGILIFVGFITVFWLLIVRWLDRVESKSNPEDHKGMPVASN